MMTESAAPPRLHHWDFSRALYLALGIPFHAAVIYSLSHEWSVSSPDKSQALTWLADFIHSFRMPGFFLLAGMFSIMLLDRQGAGPWLKSRLLRLGLPLLAATAFIVPFQIVVQSMALNLTGALPVAEMKTHIIGQLSHFGEPWISHLWFLWVLIAYCVALAGLHWLAGGPGLRSLSERFVAWVGQNRILSLAAFAAICQLAAQAQSLIVAASPYYGNAVINYNLYVVYFGFGVLVYYSNKLHDLLLETGPVAFIAGIGLALVSGFSPVDLFTHTVTVMAGIVGAALIVGYISNLARQHFGTANPKIRKLVDASFTIYLFHHPVIYVLATLFLTVNLPPVIEFAMIAPSAGLISYAIHQMLSRSPVFKLLFNGVSLKAAGPQSANVLVQPSSMSIARPYPLRG